MGVGGDMGVTLGLGGQWDMEGGAMGGHRGHGIDVGDNGGHWDLGDTGDMIGHLGLGGHWGHWGDIGTGGTLRTWDGCWGHWGDIEIWGTLGLRGQWDIGAMGGH